MEYFVENAWLPSEDVVKIRDSFRRRHVADTISETVSSLSSLEYIPQPQLGTNNAQEHPARELASQMEIFSHLDRQNSVNFPTEQDVPADLSGMWQLVYAKCYRSAVNLSSLLLYASDGSGSLRRALEEDLFSTAASGVDAGSIEFHSFKQLMMIWYLRLSCLLMLREFTKVDFELNSFGDLDDACYFVDMHPGILNKIQKFHGVSENGDRAALDLTLVPFGLRLLHAQLPLAKLLYRNVVASEADENSIKHDLSRLAFERLFVMKNKIDTMIRNATLPGSYHNGKELSKTAVDVETHALYKSRFDAVWQQRKLSVLNSLLLLSSYTDDSTTFFAMFRDMLRTLSRLESATELTCLVCELHLIRYCIRMGDIGSAANLQAHADTMFNTIYQQQLSVHSDLQLRDALNFHEFNKALLLIARDEYAAATTMLCNTDEQHSSMPSDSSKKQRLRIDRSNAAAVADFYQGLVAQATVKLEEALLAPAKSKLSPSNVSVDSASTTVLFNLSMLYELSGVNVFPRKLEVLRYAACNLPDAFNIQCLKIPPPSVNAVPLQQQQLGAGDQVQTQLRA